MSEISQAKSDLSKLPDNDHPPQIIICSATGDWVEWEKPRLPEEMDCPHGGCHCTPTLYDQRRVTVAEVERLRAGLAELYRAGVALVPHMPPMPAGLSIEWDEAMETARDFAGAVDEQEAHRG